MLIADSSNVTEAVRITSDPDFIVGGLKLLFVRHKIYV